MTAIQRSNVLKREEKGIGTISFRRLLVAGLGAILFFVFGSRIFGWALACLSGLGLLAFILLLTQPVGGFPLAVHAARLAQGLALMVVLRDPNSRVGQVIQAVLHLQPEDGRLQAEQVYRGYQGDEPLATLAEPEDWIIYREAEDDGLAFAASPLGRTPS